MLLVFNDEKEENVAGDNWVAVKKLIGDKYFVRHMDGNRCPTTEVVGGDFWKVMKRALFNMGWVEVPFTAQRHGNTRKPQNTLFHYPAPGEKFYVKAYEIYFDTSAKVEVYA